MSDIEDELLALAGGDMSSDEDQAVSKRRSRDASRSRTPGKEASSSKGVAKKATGKQGGKSAGGDDSEDEEGQASSVPGSPASQQSVPMDESDSDSDAPQSKPRGGDDENKYPVEGLFESHADKARIMNLREIEREQILAERREESERIRQNRLLRQLVVNQDKDNKKRKASAADLEDATRKTSRTRTKVGGTKVGETSSGIDALRRAREERSSRMQQREREDDRRKKRSPSYSRRRGGQDRDADDDDDSDVEWAGHGKKRSRSPDREAAPADLHDFDRVRIGRSVFAGHCFWKPFEDTVKGCFVRVNIGPDPQTHQDVYRMCLVKGFAKAKAYAMKDSQGHDIIVDMHVIASHGKAQKEWPFIMCSDKRFTDAELNRYKAVCKAEGLTVPTKATLVQKVHDINAFLARKWTDAELTAKLERQRALHVKYSGVERNQITKQLEAARNAGNAEKVAMLQEKLDNMEVPILAHRTSLAANKPKNEGGYWAQQERLAQLNAENRRRNAQEVREAQRREIMRARGTRGKINGNKISPNGKANGQANGGAPNGSGLPTPDVTTIGLPDIAKLQEQQRAKAAAKGGLADFSKPLMDDDIIGAMDLEIDVDLD